MASLLPVLVASRTNIANITPFTDRMVSEIATATGYIGPQQWIMAKGITLDTAQLAAPLARFQAGMHDAWCRWGWYRSI